MRTRTGLAQGPARHAAEGRRASSSLGVGADSGRAPPSGLRPSTGLTPRAGWRRDGGMVGPRTSAPWRALALVLTLVMMIAGLGRGSALAATIPVPALMIGDIVISICHPGGDMGGDTGDDPAGLARHACCNDCALGAPLILPHPPELSARAWIAWSADLSVPRPQRPALSRLRLPRLSQGPPSA